MALIPFLSNTKAWTEGRLPEPWDPDRVSIHAFIKSHTDGETGRLSQAGQTLPDEHLLNSANEARFVAGGLEGAFGHHARPSDENAGAKKIFKTVKAVLRNPKKSNMEAFYAAVGSEYALDYIDQLLERIVGDPSVDPDRLFRLSTWMAKRAPDRGPVKACMAIAGLFAGQEARSLFLTLGRHEEFTLYAAVALSNSLEDPESDLWSLAKSVDGWGRIQCVERLQGTKNPDIRSWLLREGYRNSVMYEYLAYICAEAGGLLEALRNGEPDAELLSGAGDIIDALIAGGPAEDIGDYADGPHAVELYLGHLSRRDLDLRDFLVVSNIDRFVTSDTFGDRELKGDWSPERRSRIEGLVNQILDREDWVDKARLGLAAEDERDFFCAHEAANRLGVDAWETLLERQKADPKGFYWWQLMQTDDVERVRRVASHAEQVLPLDEIATGPGDLLGLGEEFWAHSALDFIVQDLNRFPGVGWGLVKTALDSPVIRNRHMALRALNGWPAENWPSDARAVLEAMISVEPDAEIKRNATRLLAGEDISQDPYEGQS